MSFSPELSLEAMTEGQIRDLLDRVRAARPEVLAGLESTGSVALLIRYPDGRRVFLIQRDPDNRLFGVMVTTILS